MGFNRWRYIEGTIRITRGRNIDIRARNIESPLFWQKKISPAHQSCLPEKFYFHTRGGFIEETTIRVSSKQKQTRNHTEGGDAFTYQQRTEETQGGGNTTTYRGAKHTPLYYITENKTGKTTQRSSPPPPISFVVLEKK